jgi:predicted DCC family thiol-disulfide oxidoreductase YuxK
LKHIGLNNSQIDSIVLYQPGIAYFIKADAAFKILKELNSRYRFLLLFSFTPYLIKNSIYDYIAANRYKWYGKKKVVLSHHEN